MKITPIQLAKRVESWQKRLAPLGVGHFSIRRISLVSETPGGPDANASVQTSHDYDRVEFWFCKWFLERATEEELDRVIVHEWLHVAFRDFDNVLDRVMHWMPSASYSDFDRAVDHEREGLIERLATLITL